MWHCTTYNSSLSFRKKRRENDNLEQQAQALFKAWFVDFEPWGGVMPNDWLVGTLSELATVKYGKDHKSLADGKYPVYGSGGIMRYAEKAIYNQESVLIPRKGTLNNIMYVDDPFWSVDTMFYTEMLKPNLTKYLYLRLKLIDFEAMNSGSAIPSMTTQILNSLPIIIPSINVLADFENILQPIFQNYKIVNKESKQLAETRNTLLPKLMSGELKINDLNC